MTQELAHVTVGAGRADGAAAGAPARVVGDPVADPSSATLRLYAADWAAFLTWCRQTQHIPLPTSSDTFAAYLLAVAPRLSRGALGRRRASIGAMHRQSGLPTPLLDAVTQKALRSSAKPKTTPRVASPTSAGLLRMAKACPRDLPGLRDRALLLLVAALTRPGRRVSGDTKVATSDKAIREAMPRIFLLALDAEHIRFTATGMTLQLRARTDEGEPTQVANLIRAMTADCCPVRALEDWLRTSDTAFGPVFRKVDRWGNVEHGRLHPDAWNRILARRGGASQRPHAAAKPNR